jgi:hypothetical protein
MNDGFVFGNILGIIVGLWISIGFQDFSTDSPKNQIKKVIEVCEKDLPRNQHCVITGVVEKL